MNNFVKERDKAFVKAVTEDDWGAVRKYCKKYNMPVPKSNKVMKTGIYKAVQYCTNIPEDVKEVAFMKCLELGFSPLIKPTGEEGE